MTIKSVLFDLDGTLLDRDASLLHFVDAQYERYLQALGHIPKQKYIERFITLDNRGYTWKDKVYEELIVEFAITNIKAEQLLNDYVTNFSNYCVPFPAVHKILQWLRERYYKLGIITNGIGQFQLNNIRELEIEQYFDAILISEWEGIKKPSAEIFLRALQKLDVAAKNSIFIGDHPVNDIAAAQAIGMLGIWKKDAHWSDEVSADFVVENLSEVTDIINRLNQNT
ncbi:HAD family hydrolase [Metasolibacillus sp. FSL H7-0170]|uniref:HAD family hydrolase n=1 Tax=Metasolibacillus TaxID=2703677 RepID=UPI0007977F7C|nr:HAD family hydrolase [Metasolibacillus fluoroglycofenilyticus]KYG88930.1 L-2-haloalkanoic acid dehalogenase [[Bacillus] sp. KCTC 13219]